VRLPVRVRPLFKTGVPLNIGFPENVGEPEYVPEIAPPPLNTVGALNELVPVKVLLEASPGTPLMEGKDTPITFITVVVDGE